MIVLTDAQWLCILYLYICSDIICGKRNVLSYFSGRVVRDGAVGRLLASVAGRVREGELDLPPLGPRVRSGRLAAPELSAVRLDSTVARACGGRVPVLPACEPGP